MGKLNYPSEEILNPSKLQRKDYDHIILWMLANNESCEWSNFEQKPIEIPISTLSRHFTKLILKGYIEKYSRGKYRITLDGKKRFLELSKESKKKRLLNYPPEVILKRGRNYSHWILWMVYNNGFCKRSDFLEEPFSMNQSSLSKTLNSLIQKGFLSKENKRYIITQLGKSEYSRILQHYDLDRQTILDEEKKRIDEITTKTSHFFKKFNITDDHVKFRFLNNVLKLDYSKVNTILKDEEDFHKILLFLSINHPYFYPDYLSFEDFSRFYEIKKRILDFWVNEIVESDLYDLKFFKLDTFNDKHYYFHSNEKLEKMLRAITEEHIATNNYLEKFGRSGSFDIIIEDILEEICEKILHKDLKESLREFLPQYIKYLAYAIEIKEELKETYDKLEGIIWQNITDILQLQNSENLESQYKEKIKELDKEINLSPQSYDLYNSKIRILLYFNQYNDVLTVLEKMRALFPEKELDIMIKKAYTLKKDKKLEDGLEIIEKLLKKYPEDNTLYNYKAYWLSYLGKKQEALKILQWLTESEPEKGIYHDTYGEILISFKKYEKAIKEFQKAIEIDPNEWFIHQTYVKIGICYLELENIELAIENLKKGRELTNKIISDIESKNKWLAIAELFLAEIGEKEEMMLSN
jgi:Tfp pilus assembly protein PilF/Mn-dependent DtxR family transcriptional regulator